MGRYRSIAGWSGRALAGPGWQVGLPLGLPTLPSLLKKVGYGTTLVGKWHLGWLPDYGPLKSGYDHFFGFRGGAVDYFTHKPGVGPMVEEDLWDQDARSTRWDISPTCSEIEPSPSSTSIQQRDPISFKPPLQCASLALGGAK